MPYVLVPDGAYMCGYAHAVSDPILDKVGPGAVVPHGTAEAGGYGLSVTELVDPEGIVVYRGQTPGGLVLIRGKHGYRTVRIDGAPAEFRAKASELALRLLQFPLPVVAACNGHALPMGAFLLMSSDIRSVNYIFQAAKRRGESVRHVTCGGAAPPK